MFSQQLEFKSQLSQLKLPLPLPSITSALKYLGSSLGLWALLVIAAYAQPGENTITEVLPEPEQTVENISPKQLTPEKSAEQLRQELKIAPLLPVLPQRVYAPAASAGIPVAFGADWGDMFIGVAGATADKIRPQVDGGVSTGFGLGNSRDTVGLELTYNMLSTRKFAQNGSFDAKLHRSVFFDNRTQVAAALGWTNFANYGHDPNDPSGLYGVVDSSLYGVVTAYHILQPQNPRNSLPVTVSLGLGGAPFFTNSDSGVGIIAGAGIQVHPQIAISSAWSGRGLNLGTSFVPFPTQPLSIVVIYGDVLNNTASGSVLAVGVGYSFNFVGN